MTGQYVPLHIRRCSLEGKFLRLGWSSGWDGNFLTSQSIPLLRASVSPGQMWLFDIPLTTNTDVRMLLWNLISIDPNGQFFIRVIGPMEKVKDIAAMISTVSEQVLWLPVFCSNDYLEGWLGGALSGARTWPGRVYQDIPISNVDVREATELQTLGGGSHYLLELCTGGLINCTTAEIESSITQLLSMVAASTGELEHRFTYSQWTDVISTLLILQIIDNDDPRARIHELIDRDYVTLTLGERVIPKAIDDSLRRLLTRVLARCT